MARFGFVGPSYASQATNADNQRQMNWYCESNESGAGKAAIVMLPTPGTKLFAALGGRSVRGGLVINSRCFAVAGTELHEVMADGTHVPCGLVADDGKMASLAASSTQLLVASGGSIYVLQLVAAVINTVAVPAGAFAQIQSNVAAGTGPLGAISQVAYADGYFAALFTDLATGTTRWQLSDLNNAASWNDLYVSQVSVFPENIVAMLMSHREIVFFGAAHIQPYYDSGDTNNPWQPVSGALIEQGCGAAFSPCKLDNSWFWIGADERGAGIVWRAQGYVPTRVSNHAIEFAMQGYARIDDAVGYAYQDQGHSFYVLYFPTANATWVYDVATGMWHERGKWINGAYQAHPSQCHVYCFGKHLVGDWGSGNLYEMSIALLDDDGTEIRRQRRAPYVAAENQWIYFTRLEIEGEYGADVQLLDGNGNPRAPQMMIRWSDDAGKTWSNEEWMDAGKVGEYGLRAVIRRMGRCWGTRGRIYELTVTDPIPWRITDAYLEASPNFGPTERYASNLRKMA